jgi:short-subunit dehydrogenase
MTRDGVKTAVVTGASSGIGEATARRLDADGYALLLVARRADRLERLAGELSDARALVLDVTAADAPARVLEAVESDWDRLDLLVNNAGSAWRAAFGDEDGGFENVRRTMELNFFAPVRLAEALLPVLRHSAPSAIVNVSSIAGRIARPKSGAYSASKFALTAWSEALYYEEAPNGVHVGVVLPGFVATEGFPHRGLRGRRATRWTVSTPEKVARAVARAGSRRRAEVSVPRPWGVLPVLRAIAPRVWRGRVGRVRR